MPKPLSQIINEALDCGIAHSLTENEIRNIIKAMLVIEYGEEAKKIIRSINMQIDEADMDGIEDAYETLRNEFMTLVYNE